jgi:hypothetical protein
MSTYWPTQKGFDERFKPIRLDEEAGRRASVFWHPKLSAVVCRLFNSKEMQKLGITAYSKAVQGTKAQPNYLIDSVSRVLPTVYSFVSVTDRVFCL